MEGRWNAGGDKMEKSVAIKKKSRKGRVTVVLAGIAALILFRHFRESKRRAAIICLLLPLTACRFRYMNPEDVSGFLENLSGIVGSFQITSDHDLIGERGCGEDAYTGRYWAECEGNTGKDVIFGGASLEGRKLYVSGYERRCDGAGTR